MRILIIVDCYLPQTKSVSIMMRDLALEYSSQGHEVIVLTPDSTIKQPLAVSVEDSITVLRVKSGKIKSISNLTRAMNERKLSSLLWRRTKNYLIAHPCDLIVFYSPSIFFGKLVMRLKRYWHVPAYLILRDIFPQWAVDAKMLNKGLVYLYFRKKELQTYRAADVIGVQSPNNLTYFQGQRWAKKLQLEVLYNWFDSKNLSVKETHYRDDLNLKQKTLFVYGGNMGVAQEMDNVLILAKSLHDDPRAYFLLVGDGSEVPRIKKLISEQSITNISVLPAVPSDEFYGILSESNVGLITLARNLTTQNIPGKLLAYLNAGLPILASVNPHNDLIELIQNNHAGFAVIAGDQCALLKCAQALLNNFEMCHNISRNAKELLFQRFSVQSGAEQILKAISSL